jgi:hypothetical protein
MTICLCSIFRYKENEGLINKDLDLKLGAAMVTTFKTTVWTDVFINLVEKKGGTAKLERLAAGLKK